VPASTRYWAWLENDWRQPTRGWVEYNWGGDSAGGTSRRVAAGITLKPSTSLEFSLRPSYSWNYDDAQWVENADTDGDGQDDRYVYGELDSKTLDLTTRANIIFSPRLSLEIYAQPFVTAGEYTGFKELVTPDSYRFAPVGEPDDNPDFRRRSLRSNVVLRWEYLPGSTVFLVWSQNRGDSSSRPRLRALHNLGSSLSDAGTNVLFLKATYWANP